MEDQTSRRPTRTRRAPKRDDMFVSEKAMDDLLLLSSSIIVPGPVTPAKKRQALRGPADELLEDVDDEVAPKAPAKRRSGGKQKQAAVTAEAVHVNITTQAPAHPGSAPMQQLLPDLDMAAVLQQAQLNMLNMQAVNFLPLFPAMSPSGSYSAAATMSLAGPLPTVDPLQAQAPIAGTSASAPEAGPYIKEDTTVLYGGFAAVPPGLIYKQFGEPIKSSRIAALDLSDVLIRPAGSGRSYFKDAYDFSLYNERVVEKLTEYQNQGYKIVIFTNQGQVGVALDGAASATLQDMLTAFTSMVPGVSMLFMVTTGRQSSEWRKPNTAVWQWFCDHILSDDGVTPDLDHSFFVGDTEDGVNAQFADNIGIKDYRTAVDEFGPEGEVVIPPVLPPQPTRPLTDHEASSPNADLVALFYQLAAHVRSVRGQENGACKESAFRKVAQVLSTVRFRITDDKEVLKQVELRGVGRGSLNRIKEYLKTGTLSDFSL